jgi:pimeloyl-[acyl-carrier protein] methyl ester esterase
MIHGWGMHSGVWRDFALKIASMGYRVTLADLPGHGRSGMVDRYDLDGIASVLLACAPKNSHLVGWSLGGLVALHMANHSPSNFRTLSIVAGNVRFCACAEWPGMDAGVLEKFAEDVVADHHRTLLRFFALQTWGMDDAKDQIKILKQGLEECDEPDLLALQGGLEILRLKDLRSELSRLPLPVLVLLGAKDRLVPVDVGRTMQGLSERCWVHVLPRSAHVPFITEPDESIRTLTRFWEDCEHGYGRS